MTWLTAIRERVEKEFAQYPEFIDTGKVLADVDRLLAALDLAMGALKEYGRHRHDACGQFPTTPCICGLDDTLAKIEKGEVDG